LCGDIRRTESENAVGADFAGVSLSVASVLRHQKLSWMARLCSAGYNVRQFVSKISQQPRQKWVFFAIFSLISVELLLRPLQPPLVFDEVMYHLPHVRLWLRARRLSPVVTLSLFSV
jgi:hypothetical protein